MKKLISILLVLSMVVSFCACTADPTPTTDSTADPSAPADATNATVAAEAEDNKNDWEDIDEFTPNEKGIYQIHSAEGFKNIANVLDGKFELLCNIDLGGAEWVPVGTQDAPFTGRLNGKDFTVSNFTISQPTVDGDMGVFGVLEGSIVNTYFREVTITTTDKTMNVGTIAGVNNGEILRTRAYGTIEVKLLAGEASCGGVAGVSTGRLEYVTTNVDINCETTTAANIGAAFGMQNGGKILSCEIGGSVSITDREKKNVGTLIGYGIDSKVEENLYVGETAVMDEEGKVVLTGLAKNVSEVGNSTQYFGFRKVWPEDAQARRDKVVELGFQMATVEWTVPEKLVVQNICGTTCCPRTRTFIPGVTYRGIPYNHYNSSWQRFMYAMEENEDGVLTVSEWARNLTGLDGNGIWDMYIGNDCCSAMIQLYQCVADSCNLQRSPYQFPWYNEEYEKTMMQETWPIRATGTIPVGGWEYDFIIFDQRYLWTDGVASVITGQPVDPNTGLSGVDRMYWCYAQMSKGDMLQNSYTRADGHCLMVTGDPVVMLDQDGNIDPEKSYVMTIQQVAGFHEVTSTKDNIYEYDYGQYTSSWWFEGERAKLTFAVLAEESYLPVTFIELMEGSDKTPVITIEGGQEGRFALTTGTVTSNFNLDSVELIVTDDTGNEVLNKRMFVTVDRNADQYTETWNTRVDTKIFDMGHFVSEVSQVQWDTSKTYHCTVKAYLNTVMHDNIITVSEFTF